MSMRVNEIRVDFQDQAGHLTTILSRAVDGKWTRIVRGSPEAPCFGVTTMDTEEVVEQLNRVIEGVKCSE